MFTYLRSSHTCPPRPCLLPAPSPTWITAMTLTLPASALTPPQPVRMTAPQAPTAGAGASHWPSEQTAAHPRLSRAPSFTSVLGWFQAAHFTIKRCQLDKVSCVVPPRAHAWPGPCSGVSSALCFSPPQVTLSLPDQLCLLHLCGTLSPHVAFCPLPWCLQVLPNTRSPLHTNLQVANFQGCAPVCQPLDVSSCAALLCFSRHRACVLGSFSHVWLFVTTWAAATRLLCLWGFSRQEC